MYPVHVGGRPPHFPLTYLPITFEMGVLAAAVTGFVGVIIAGRLLRLWSPIMEVDALASASRDRYWLAIDGADQNFTSPSMHALLEGCQALQVLPFGAEQTKPTHPGASKP